MKSPRSTTPFVVTVRRLLVLLPILACWVPLAASAYCLENATAVPLHAQSLDSGVFTVDIPPGEERCCRAATCVGGNRPDSLVLIVTGYIPVGQARQPGWHAECRVRLQPEGRVVVRGEVTQIRCERQDP
ncbi:MAG: hypothetical protein HQL66_07545 [Magnetococcales bacterium]|nr:hypothetical protein [Magnetococcales bacterium]